MSCGWDVSAQAAVWTSKIDTKYKIGTKYKERLTMQQGEVQKQLVQGQPQEGAAVMAEAAEAAASGCACTLFAVVNSDGSLARGFGAVSSRILFTGQYEVVFNRNMTGCAFVATLGSSGSFTVPPSGEIAVAGRTDKVNAVFIATYGSGGAFANGGFHLAVHCRQ
jgi:hypothetical protein